MVLTEEKERRPCSNQWTNFHLWKQKNIRACFTIGKWPSKGERKQSFSLPSSRPTFSLTLFVFLLGRMVANPTTSLLFLQQPKQLFLKPLPKQDFHSWRKVNKSSCLFLSKLPAVSLKETNLLLFSSPFTVSPPFLLFQFSLRNNQNGPPLLHPKLPTPFSFSWPLLYSQEDACLVKS